jgi:lysophospholipase L1-like esterase
LRFLILAPILLSALLFGEAAAPAKKKTTRRKRTPPAKVALKPLPSLDPVPIEAPGDSLAPFFQTLAKLEQESAASPEPRVVRILHFGDSHVAGDNWTGYLRKAFQNRFGDAGPGLVLPGAAFKGYRHIGAKSAHERGWEGVTLRAPTNDGLIGLPGAILHGVPRGLAHASARVTSSFSAFELQLVDATGETSCVSLAVDGSDSVSPFEEQIAESFGVLKFLRNPEPLEFGPHTLGIAKCGGVPRILGLDLASGKSGIIYDSLGINGAQLTDVEHIQPDLRQTLMQHMKPALVIVSYGTNDMSRLGLTSGEYKADCLRVLGGIRRDVPDAAVLVSGPLDRQTKVVKRRLYFKERSTLVIDALRQAALETGCGFWDAREAMGGEGAMLRWRRAGLAQPDLVHLNGHGYEKLAGLLFGQILAAYQNAAAKTTP